MGSKSGEPGISPKHAQKRRMAEREGFDMPAAGVTSLGSPGSTSTPMVGWESAEMQPLWPAEEERAGGLAAPLPSRAVRANLTSPICPW